MVVVCRYVVWNFMDANISIFYSNYLVFDVYMLEDAILKIYIKLLTILFLLYRFYVVTGSTTWRYVLFIDDNKSFFIISHIYFYHKSINFSFFFIYVETSKETCDLPTIIWYKASNSTLQKVWQKRFWCKVRMRVYSTKTLWRQNCQHFFLNAVSLFYNENFSKNKIAKLFLFRCSPVLDLLTQTHHFTT